MNLGTLISSNAVINNNDIKSKKRALELLAEKLATQANCDQQTNTQNEDNHKAVCALDIFQLLVEREKLGSTSLGHGVALPHTRTKLTDRAIGVFLKIENGIDFDSPDNHKTDLIFALMVPEHYTDEHLKILAYLASLFNNNEFCKKIRHTSNTEEIYHDLINWQLENT